MSRERVRAVVQNLRSLFNVGATAGLTDGQLLERFATRRGEAAELAFAAVVERHGPMVLRTCRGVLRDEHHAQDAFQATFLVLARKGATLWVRDSLGPWLHRVACRVALRDKRATGRRRAVERQAGAVVPPRGEPGWDDLAGVLHEELDRLPERYRIPIVLCDLNGRTYEEAARHLRCPVGTIKSRLARGRERLRDRLSRRGLAPAAGALGAVLSTEPASAELPPAAFELVTRAALTTAAASANARALADETLRSLTLAKLRWVAAGVGVIALVCAGASRGIGWLAGPPPAGAAPREAPPELSATRPDDQATTEERRVPPFDEVRVAGRIKVVVTLDPDRRVTATGDARLRRALRTRVDKLPNCDRLLLELDSNDAGREAVVEVRITTPRLSGIIAEDSSTVEARSLRNESVRLTVSDTAKFTVAGTSGRVTAAVGDAGELDASRLEAGEVTVTATGWSSSVFHAREALNVVSGGEARVEYLGTPARLSQITADSSRLIQR